MGDPDDIRDLFDDHAEFDAPDMDEQVDALAFELGVAPGEVKRRLRASEIEDLIGGAP